MVYIYIYIIKGDGLKQSCGLTLMAISQNNSEVMIKFSKKCVPLAFFAIHQPNSENSGQTQQQQQLQQQIQNKNSIWNDVFDEITSGTEYAIRANLNEILALVKIGLEHQSWKMRIQAASTISTIATKLQSHMEKESLNQILEMLVPSLSSRNWVGKVRKLK